MRSTRIALVFALAALFAASAFATNGYFTHGSGTASKALAGASVALPQEALDSSSNPAAIAFVPRGHSAALAVFSPDRSYTITGAPSGMQGTFGLQPGTVTSKSNYFPMPSLAWNFRPSDVNAFAITAVAHGGMNTDYRTNTFYGSDHTGVNLMQAFLSGVYARKLTANQALGISAIVAYQQFKASGLEAFSNFSNEPSCLTGNGYERSTGYGVKIGYLAQTVPQLSFGAAYTPKISMGKLDRYCGLFAEDGSFDIPSSATAGLAYKATKALTFTTDYERINYSDVRSIGDHLLPNLMTSPLGTDTGAGFGWNDINVYKAGVQFRGAHDIVYRAGFSKCDQPIPDSEVLFNILAPGVIEQHYTAGISTPAWRGPGRVSVALMYAPTKKISGANPLEAPGAQQIQLKMNEWEVEFGYSFGF